MTDERIIEKMAKLDGRWIKKPIMSARYGGSPVCIGELYPHINELPKYLEDHNAVQRVIDGLECEGPYVHALLKVTGKTWGYVPTDKELYVLLKATPRQKCEAILRAKGMWEA